MKRRALDFGIIPISVTLQILEFFTLEIRSPLPPITSYFGYFTRLLPIRNIQFLFPSINHLPLDSKTSKFSSEIPIPRIKHLTFSEPSVIDASHLDILENLYSLINIKLDDNDTLFGLSVLFQLQNLKLYVSAALLQSIQPKEILGEYLIGIKKVQIYIPDTIDPEIHVLYDPKKDVTNNQKNNSASDTFSYFSDINPLSNNSLRFDTLDPNPLPTKRGEDDPVIFQRPTSSTIEKKKKKKKKKKRKRKKKKRTRKFLKKRVPRSSNLLPLHIVQIPAVVASNVISYTLRKRVGEEVKLQEKMCDVRLKGNNKVMFLKAPCDGKIEKIYQSKKYNKIVKIMIKRETEEEEIEGEGEDDSDDDMMDENKPIDVVGIRGCKHEEILKKFCLICNQRVSDEVINSMKNKNGKGKEREYIPYHYGDPSFLIQRERAIKMEEMERMKSEKMKKLILVLDLDLTLIHCTKTTDNVRKWANCNAECNINEQAFPLKKLIDSCPPNKSEPIRDNGYQVFTFKLYGQEHSMKKRPYLDWFLSSLSPYFRYHVFTHGTREYAKRVVQFIDPTRTYFSDRLVTRDDDENQVERKSLKYKFPSDQSRILIIDDNENVWKGPEDGEDNRKRLIRIYPYIWFGMSDLSDSWRSNELDTQLVIIREKLMKIYELYWNMNSIRQDISIDVSDLLEEEKRKVFGGLKFCFSGLLPRELGQFSAHVLVKRAAEFGAEVSKRLDNGVTHLIVNSQIPDFTKKIKEASESKDILIVRHEWFFDCLKEWKVLNEENYGLKIKDKVINVRRINENNKMKDEEEDSEENKKGIINNNKPKKKLEKMRDEENQSENDNNNESREDRQLDDFLEMLEEDLKNEEMEKN